MADKNIKITVMNRRAILEGSPVIICGNSGYTVTFSFDDEWDLTGVRTARFVYIKAGEVRHEDKVFEGNVVDVPILADVSFVKVGVFAGDLCTTTPARINCESSILCGSGAVHEPTPDVYNQIMALFNEMAEKGAFGATEEQMQQVADNAASIEALKDGTTPAGDAEKLGGHGSDYFATAEDVQSLQDGTKKAGDAEKLGGHGSDYFVTTEDFVNHNHSGIKSENGTYETVMQGDGNLVTYNHSDGSVAFDAFSTAKTADLANYFKNTGGSINGNVVVTSDSALERSFEARNSLRRVKMTVNTAGEMYLWDGTNNKEILRSKVDGTNTFNGTASGDLPLDVGSGNKQISTTGNVPLLFKTTVNGGLLLGFSDSSGTLGYLGIGSKNNPVYAVDGIRYSLHHDGNSKKIVVSETPLTDANAVRIW